MAAVCLRYWALLAALGCAGEAAPAALPDSSSPGDGAAGDVTSSVTPTGPRSTHSGGATGSSTTDAGQPAGARDGSAEAQDASAGDAGHPDAAPAGGPDASAASPPAPELPDGGEDVFPTALYVGLWHVGWAGGNDHYSWVRFHPDASLLSGRWETAPVTCRRCDWYFPCDGTDGTFTVLDASEQRIVLHYPSTCEEGFRTEETWTIQAINEPSTTLAERGVDMQLLFRVNEGTTTGAHRYPETKCPAELTGCPEPFLAP